jgi:hypothetical protein
MPNANTANYSFLSFSSPPSFFSIFNWKHFSIIIFQVKIPRGYLFRISILVKGNLKKQTKRRTKIVLKAQYIVFKLFQTHFVVFPLYKYRIFYYSLS